MKDRAVGYLFLTPALMILLIITLYPFIYSLSISFTDYKVVSPFLPKNFIGIQNYIQMFQDEDFRGAALVTLIMGVLTLGGEFLLGLFLALLTFKEVKGVSFFRLAYLLPVVITPIVTGMNFRYNIFNAEYGFLNYFLRLIHVDGVSWLTQPTYALMSVVLTDIWQWSSFMFLIFLAGLQSIPGETFEASRVDGASPLQTLIRITLPQMKAIISVALLFRLIDFIRYLDNVFVMTYGGPGNATATISFHAYKTGFIFFQTGYAAAMGIVILVGITILANVLISALRQ